MKNLLRQSRYLMSETDTSRLPPSLAEVAFIGRSNVGKSLAICAVCDNKKLARVSKTPGRTRGINVFAAAHGKWIIDLPGFGFAKANERQRDYWPKMIKKYLPDRPNLKRVYFLIDAQQGLEPKDIELIKWLREGNIPNCIVGVKIDRIGKTRHQELKNKIAQAAGRNLADILWISAKKKEGLNNLRWDIASALSLVH